MKIARHVVCTNNYRMAIEIPTSVLESPVYIQVQKFRVTYQEYLDKSVPLTSRRWMGFGILLALFFLRIIVTQGWYIVCYALGIYLLNLFLAFLTPKFDPSLEQDEEEEFRPFIRRLPEFKFWYNATRATVVALLTSFFTIFDIPVFWPILLMYFIILFTLTMRKQIQHMLKYKYLPHNILDQLK